MGKPFIAMKFKLHFIFIELFATRRLVVDTAYLFEREGSSYDSPSLREIAKQVLNMTLPDIHDSVRDAGMYYIRIHCLS